MNTYNWQIMSMQVKPVEDDKQDVVITVNYVCTGRDEDANVGVNNFGTITVTLDPEGEFTPYDQLTEEQVMGWVFSQINKSEAEANIDMQIAQIKNPPVITPPLPWNSSEAV